jgi:hypothetical protein
LSLLDLTSLFPSRSLPDFGGVTSKKLNAAPEFPRNGLRPQQQQLQGGSMLLGNGTMIKQQQQQVAEPPPKEKIHVRTNWAAKYLNK